MIRFLVIALVAAAPVGAQDTGAAAQDTQGGDAQQTTAAPDPAKKLICRRQPVTGSLTQVRKTCMTREDWAKTTDATQQFGRDLVDGMRSKSAGN